MLTTVLPTSTLWTIWWLGRCWKAVWFPELGRKGRMEMKGRKRTKGGESNPRLDLSSLDCWWPKSRLSLSLCSFLTETSLFPFTFSYYQEIIRDLKNVTSISPLFFWREEFHSRVCVCVGVCACAHCCGREGGGSWMFWPAVFVGRVVWNFERISAKIKRVFLWQTIMFKRIRNNLHWNYCVPGTVLIAQ